jgi:hypothetical protein
MDDAMLTTYSQDDKSSHGKAPQLSSGIFFQICAVGHLLHFLGYFSLSDAQAPESESVNEKRPWGSYIYHRESVAKLYKEDLC